MGVCHGAFWEAVVQHEELLRTANITLVETIAMSIQGEARPPPIWAQRTAFVR